MKFKGLGHAALSCSNYEESLKFYRDVLGLKEKFSLFNKNGDLWLTYMEVAPGEFVELFPAKTGKDPTYVPEGTFAHMCLLVPDIVKAAHELQNKGVTLYYGPSFLGMPIPVPYVKKICKAGEYCFYIKGPDGFEIEFMQYEEPTTLMIMSDEQLAELEEKLKTDTYI